jgi:hypothetical protein
MTSNETPAGNTGAMINQEFEGKPKRENLLHAWEDNTSENQKK